MVRDERHALALGVTSARQIWDRFAGIPVVERMRRIQRYMLNPDGQPEAVPVTYACTLIDGGNNQVLEVRHRSADGMCPVIIRLDPATGKSEVLRGLPGWGASGYRYFVYYCGGNETDCLYLEVFMSGHEREHEILAPQARPMRVLDL